MELRVQYGHTWEVRLRFGAAHREKLLPRNGLLPEDLYQMICECSKRHTA